VGLIYLDSVAVIYSMERFPAHWPRIRPLWEQSSRGEVVLTSSELTLHEALVGPLKHGNQALAADYEKLLTKTDVRLLPVSLPVLRLAAWLRVDAKLKTPDAIHAATALLAGCEAFITNDADFERVAKLPVRLISKM